MKVKTSEELYGFYIEHCADWPPLTFEEWRVKDEGVYSAMWEAVCELIPEPCKED
jgi:hypothetical protein